MHCPKCSSKIEPEVILCPSCAIKGDIPPSTEQVCDIFLMGFSDSSSCDQVIDYLLEHSFLDSRDDLFARLSNLPVLLTKGMVSARAHRLREDLENRGGIIELRDRQMRDRGMARKIVREGEQETESSPPAEVSAPGSRVYLFLFLVSLAAAAYLAYFHDFSLERKTVQRAVQKITSRMTAPVPDKQVRAPEVSVPEKISTDENLDQEGIRLNNEGVALMDKGDFMEAVQSFESARKLIPGDATILQNLYRSWLLYGYKQLEGKEYAKSIQSFKEALKINDQSSEIYKLMGMAALNLQDENSAAGYFEAYIKQVPDDLDVDRILGEILYKQNKLEEGIKFLKIYLAGNPGDSRIQDMVKKAGREMTAEHGFDTREGEHFDVSFDGSQNMEAGSMVVALLESAYSRIGAELNYYPSEHVVTILYSDEDFQNVTQTPEWTKGLYDGKIRIPIGGLKEKSRMLERVVMHEYTHAIIHQMVGTNCPTWLNEGVAQYFEGEPAEGIAGSAGQILKSGDFIPLKKLEGSFMNLDAKSAAMAYTESYTVVDHIIKAHGIYAVQKLLSDISNGADVESALRSAIGADYNGLQEDWLKYLARIYS
ncbi:MAG: peptidase MA family metallohydrolase [bacterium]